MAKDHANRQLSVGDEVLVSLQSPLIMGTVTKVQDSHLADMQGVVGITLGMPLIGSQQVAQGVFKLAPPDEKVFHA